VDGATESDCHQDDCNYQYSNKVAQDGFNALCEANAGAIADRWGSEVQEPNDASRVRV
jgi:hypothetical protein